MKYVPMKVAMNRKQLIPNCHGLMSGVLKFSFDSSSNVAAPSSPTTAGRSPLSTLCTGVVLIYFRNIFAISIISISDGNTRAVVAVTLPSTYIPSPYPAL